MKTYNIFNNDYKNLGQFNDKRGSISDIFINEPVDHSCWIVSEKGAVRGNHYHKKSTQYTLVLTGRLFYISKCIISGNMCEGTFEKGTIIISPPMEAHAMKALETKCEFIAFASGPRGGKNYESDTFRLTDEQKLI